MRIIKLAFCFAKLSKAPRALLSCTAIHGEQKCAPIVTPDLISAAFGERGVQ
jgi:hypothetical protein